MAQILIEQNFKAKPQQVFDRLGDHEELGRLLDTDIRCIKDAPDTSVPNYNRNGKGSIRRIKSFGVPAFEETVTMYESPSLIEYRITKGSPVKNHLGRLEFSETEEGTYLKYTIDYEPKFWLPGIGMILKQAIQGPLLKGLRKLAREYEQQD